MGWLSVFFVYVTLFPPGSYTPEASLALPTPPYLQSPPGPIVKIHCPCKLVTSPPTLEGYLPKLHSLTITLFVPAQPHRALGWVNRAVKADKNPCISTLLTHHLI
jgi:hypothetical protein